MSSATVVVDTPARFSEDEVAVRARLDEIDVVPLLLAVSHATGDRSILRQSLRPDPATMMMPAAGMTAAQATEGRNAAASALCRWRDSGYPAAPTPTGADLRSLIDFMTGGAAVDEYMPLLREELAIDGEDLRAPEWALSTLAPQRSISVAIVGAGMSGIAVAHRLQQAGVPFTIFEKNPEVGGTWFDNSYPGCRVDVPNHLYSYSFAQTAEWPQFYSTQGHLLDYFRACFDSLGLGPRTRFGTEVVGAEWSEHDSCWMVLTRASDGSEQVEAFDTIISAVGQLNRPSIPNITGRERFAGSSFHSARWDHSVELDGRRVGVIGTGASGAQLIPHIAARASELTIFQRTPSWLLPTPNYQHDIGPGLRWLLETIPSYKRWDRLWIFWQIHEGLLPMTAIDDTWTDSDRSVSELNDRLRTVFTEYLAHQFGSPDLLAKALPLYPPLAKRFVRDDGTWAETLTQGHVHLVTEVIAEITATGVRTADGTEHEFDVLVYATGFEASQFLAPICIVGRSGADLHDRWAGDSRAYLGMTVPDFPNLFLMYGPNTNIVVNGSIILFSECEADYIVDSIRLMVAGGHRSMECRATVHDAYNERVDAGNRRRAWGVPAVDSWYKNATGRVSQNWPFGLLEFWQQTRTANSADYHLR